MKPESLNRQFLAEDIAAYQALQTMPDYAPSNAAFSKTAFTTIHDAMVQKQAVAAQSEAAAKVARDDSVAGEWAMHSAILGAAAQPRKERRHQDISTDPLTQNRRTIWQTQFGTISPTRQ